MQHLSSLAAVNVGNKFHRWWRQEIHRLSVDAGNRQLIARANSAHDGSASPAGISSAVVQLRTTDLILRSNVPREEFGSNVSCFTKYRRWRRSGLHRLINDRPNRLEYLDRWFPGEFSAACGLLRKFVYGLTKSVWWYAGGAGIAMRHLCLRAHHSWLLRE